QKCIITLENNKKFICSPIHKFSVIDYNSNISEVSNNRKFVECKDLIPGISIECNVNSDLRVGTKETNVPGVVTSYFSIKVESMEITEEYIDMYDVCNTDDGY